MTPADLMRDFYRHSKLEKAWHAHRPWRSARRRTLARTTSVGAVGYASAHRDICADRDTHWFRADLAELLRLLNRPDQARYFAATAVERGIKGKLVLVANR
ncbi:MAG: hypothetical protein U0559_01735 [Anaerolineae bacterium]